MKLFWQKWGLSLVLGLILVGIILFLLKESLASENLSNESCDIKSAVDGEMIKIKMGENIYQVEVARSAANLAKGLSGRSQVPSDGMIFFLNEKEQPTFWMKEMNFPLDILWIENDNVREISKNVPAPEKGTASNLLPIYSPQSDRIDVVLEMEAGKSDMDRILPGTRLERLCN